MESGAKTPPETFFTSSTELCPPPAAPRLVRSPQTRSHAMPASAGDRQVNGPSASMSAPLASPPPPTDAPGAERDASLGRAAGIAPEACNRLSATVRTTAALRMLWRARSSSRSASSEIGTASAAVAGVETVVGRPWEDGAQMEAGSKGEAGVVPDCPGAAGGAADGAAGVRGGARIRAVTGAAGGDIVTLGLASSAVDNAGSGAPTTNAGSNMPTTNASSDTPTPFSSLCIAGTSAAFPPCSSAASSCDVARAGAAAQC
mmetsp:Transcript_35426/g.114135  ORF Transcript_35426/g.114135 Transcript_35426/m.114135 type:complete len:260 (+) Transcript_35426:498-1277(+)